MRGLIFNLLDWITDRLVELMIWMEPKKPRRQELDYHVSALPEDVLAIVRISWYKQGKPDEVDETILFEDGQNGYDAFAALVGTALKQGANVSIRSGYQPEDLGIHQ
jgi:hypothetical protein